MPSSPPSLALARRLLVLEQARVKSTGGARSTRGAPDAASDPAARVCETLREILTAFAGTAGFRSLLTRALTLAEAQAPALACVQVLEDGSLSGLEQLGGASSKAATAAGRVLVAQLLDLLITFIGEPLTLQLVRIAWPAASASASRSRNKGTV